MIINDLSESYNRLNESLQIFGESYVGDIAKKIC